MTEPSEPAPPAEHHGKDCRYGYGANTAALARGLSAPYARVLAPGGDVG